MPTSYTLPADQGYGKYFKVGLVEDLDYKETLPSCDNSCSNCTTMIPAATEPWGRL